MNNKIDETNHCAAKANKKLDEHDKKTIRYQEAD